MSDNIIGTVVDAISDCVKVVGKNTNVDSSDLGIFVSGVVGGALLGVFSPTIGVPLILLSTVGGVYSVVKSSSNSTINEIVESAEVYDDVFDCIDCTNKNGEKPILISCINGVYLYNRPKGITLKDILKHEDVLKTELGFKNLSIKLVNNNKQFTLSEYEDKLRGIKRYVNNYRSKSDGLIAYLGVGLSNDELIELAINFSKRYHLLVASATGGGKSTLLRTILIDLMLNYTPYELVIYIIDLKRVEFYNFAKYKHVANCVTDITKVEGLIKSISEEVNRREKLFVESDSANIIDHNRKSNVKLQYMVVLIDEFSEIAQDKKLIKELVIILNKARAFGIYFILATQHPSAEILSGALKANFVQRIGFKTTSQDATWVIMDDKSIPLKDITVEGRGYYKYGTEVVEYQGYYICDDTFKNTKEVTKDILKEFEN